MFTSNKNSFGRVVLVFFFLATFLVACDSGTQTVTPTPTPQASKPLNAGHGGGSGRIAFTCLLPARSANTICLSALDGSGLRQFTHLPAGACCPQWSPDGKRLAFSVMSGPPLNHDDIWVMNADGSGLVNLTHAPQQGNLAPSWSPDGKQILFTADLGHIPEPYLMNADGSQKRPLLVDMKGEFATWSPDGRKIAFVSTLTDTLSAISVMNSDGSAIKRVLQGPEYYYSLVWSPDSKRLLYGDIAYASGQTSGQSDVYVTNIDSSHQVRLTNSPAGFDSAPASWSPDGTKILFGRVHPFGEHLHSFEGAIWIMNADGSGQSKLPLPTRVLSDAVWQP